MNIISMPILLIMPALLIILLHISYNLSIQRGSFLWLDNYPLAANISALLCVCLSVLLIRTSSYYSSLLFFGIVGNIFLYLAFLGTSFLNKRISNRIYLYLSRLFLTALYAIVGFCIYVLIFFISCGISLDPYLCTI